MANIVEFFLKKAIEDNKNISPMKLQKLMFYAQVRNITLLGEKIFEEEPEAWDNWPVFASLWKEVKYYDLLGKVEEGLVLGEAEMDAPLSWFTEPQKNIIYQVWEHYGWLPAEKLSEMTHNETPWKEARQRFDAEATSDEKCQEVITTEAIKKYYQKQQQYSHIIDEFLLEEAKDIEQMYQDSLAGKSIFATS